MTFKDVLECFQLREPLRGQILAAVFGQEAYLGPYAAIEADKVLLVGMLQLAHATIFFDGEKAWRSFCEIVTESVPPSISQAGGIYFTPPDEAQSANVLCIVTDGRFLGLVKVGAAEDAGAESGETYDLLDEYNAEQVGAAMATPCWSSMLSLVQLHQRTLGQIDVYRTKQKSAGHDPAQRASDGPLEAGVDLAKCLWDDPISRLHRPAGDGGPSG